jgi:undecaprenyl diphosphate synthase
MPTLSPPLPSYTDHDLAGLGLERDRLPGHVAIIMDGNGRWAQSRGLPRIEGHRRGLKTVQTIVEESSRLGIGQLTLYCLSSENWKRPRLELNFLMALLEQYVIEERAQIMRQNLRFAMIGRREGLSRGVLAEVGKTMDATAGNTGMRLCLAVNYGGRMEIVDAIREMAGEVAAGRLSPDAIDEQTVADHLYTRGMPDPDLLVRTAGEMRVSNFLLWQISYAELWVTGTHWPDFQVSHLHAALADYAGRNRRFGGLKG